MFYGTWVPGGFPPSITLAAKLTLLGTAGVRGVDLFSGDSESTARRLTAVESAAPLWVWGLILITCCTLGFVGIIIRRSTPILIAHIIGFVTYSAFAAGLVVDVVRREGTSNTIFAIAIGVGVALYIVSYRITTWAKSDFATLISLAVSISVAMALMSVQLDGLRNATVLVTVAIMHALMALGTASHRRQAKLEQQIRDGVGNV